MDNSQTRSFLCNRSISLIKTTCSTLWKLNKLAIRYCFYNSLYISLRLTKYLLLWCVLKLLSVSKRLEGITGANRDNLPEDNPTIRQRTKSPRVRQKRYRGPIEEPSFNTTLTTPIEEVLEETVNEDLVVSPKKSPIKRRSRKTKKSPPNSSGENPSIDNQDWTSTTTDSEFIPVVRDRKAKKILKKDDTIKLPSNIDVKQGNNSKTKAENLIEINREPIKLSVQPIEIKESKKVNSQISYAKIASKSFGSWEEICTESESPIESNDSLRKDEDRNRKEITTNSQQNNQEELVEPTGITENGTRDSNEENNSQTDGNLEEKDFVKTEICQFEPKQPNIELIKSETEIVNLQQNSENGKNSSEVNNLEDFATRIETCELQNAVEAVNLIESSEGSTGNVTRDSSEENNSQLDSNLEEKSVDFVTKTEICEFEPKQPNIELIKREIEIVNSQQNSENYKNSSEVNNLEDFATRIETCELQNAVEAEGSTRNVIRDSSEENNSQTDSNLEEKSAKSVDFVTKTEIGEFEPKQPNIELIKREIEIVNSQQELVENGTRNSSEEDFATIIETCKLQNAVQAVNSTESSQTHSNLEKKSAKIVETQKEFLEAETKDSLIETSTCRFDENLEEIQTKFLEIEKQIEKESLMMSSTTQIRVLTLNDKEHQDSTIYRLEKNWILQFRIGPSLMGRKINLYCNYPKINDKFDRNLYNLLEWQQDQGCHSSDDTALLIEIKIKLSGSFHYYFTYNNDDDDHKHQGSGFFLVDPILKYGNNEELPLDCIQCQTVLAKCLGPFDTWENKLLVAKESGYNMIHFTPIQELGGSNSSYSLSEQLKVNPVFKTTKGQSIDFKDIENLTKKLRNKWKILSICDIVLNHTANESLWLKQHPEVTYNCLNCPYMRPSYLLDIALYQFSIDISNGLYEDRGIPNQINNEEHLNSIRYHLHNDVLTKINLHEMFICNVNKLVAEFSNLARNNKVTIKNNVDLEQLELLQDPEYRRLHTTIDMNLALKLYNIYRTDCYDEETRLKRCTEEFKHKLDQLNNAVIIEINNHLNAAIDNCIAGIRYFRIQSDGPRIKQISSKNPLVPRYFTDYTTNVNNLKEYEQIMYSDNGKFLMAHNGWVMNTDPLKNFAASDSYVYLRRELIAWGDSVKLRYGNQPDDCPFLWDYMRKYVEQTVQIFDGIRLDNCHSTPIPVAEYLLDCARRIRPDLYVVAELFTNSDMTDNIFVNRLGITSLIREAMSAWDSHEQGRLVYRYGGYPVGSFYQPNIRPLVPTIAHALFMDLTHDNPSPIEKRSIFDLLPSTGLVNMACCASGSNRGYDELVPHHIHVVDEKRQYTEWVDNDDDNGDLRYITKKSGIISAKKALNDLHFLLGKQGFNQVYVDQIDSDIVAITRHCPDTHQSYILVAFTAFQHPSDHTANNQRYVKPLRVEGVLDEIVLEATLTHIDPNMKYAKFDKFLQDPQWINGLNEYQVILNQHLQPENSTIFERVDSGDAKMIQLNFKNFKPGSIAVIKVSLPQDMKDAIKNVRNLIKQFTLNNKENELTKIINILNLSDLNRCLYRCDQEERDEGYGFDTYNIPGYGNLVYAGLQGFMSLLSTIRPNNDLGHPMCGNLRDGNWMIDYIWQRLKLDEGTKPLGQWFEENTKSLKLIPRYLVPCYFDVVVTGLYVLLIEQCYKLMSNFVKNGSTFVKALSLGSVQFGAYIKSSDLPILSPNLSPPKPPQRCNNNGELIQACITLSAGLPHFSVGYMRNWGRDTFIALRGLFLLTGRYQEARYHILGYAQCLRHGLIPNLLDGGRNSRFNCRDAIWWWLYCIKCYVEDAPNGISILTDKVSRIFPKDDSQPQPSNGCNDQLLYDVIQEALLIHFQGLIFRERNAGKQIDEHMTDKGFNNQIGIHPDTGFVFGGNLWNCGTWMDKMGSSDKAGNRGKPATPRDGSAIELIGLSKACINWLNNLYQQNLYPYDGVKRISKNGSEIKWTFNEWSNKIQINFEKYFYINMEPITNEIRPDLINKRGIYKDCYGASQEWTDYQLRCNFPIAMVVAPELFNPKHAWIALETAEKHLLGPLGMKTLDPEDWAYNGVYDNANDSDNCNIAHGFNYHQGPEWVWPVGFFLRAKLQFAQANGVLEETISKIKLILSKHFVELQTSVWRGLPELTNKNGDYCSFSSRTQAWSMSCILEVLYDLQRIEQKQSMKIN